MAFAAHGARALVRGGGFETMEGASRGRNLVIEFPSYQAALDRYRIADCRAAMALRLPASRGGLIEIEGDDGSQPG